MSVPPTLFWFLVVLALVPAGLSLYIAGVWALLGLRWGVRFICPHRWRLTGRDYQTPNGWCDQDDATDGGLKATYRRRTWYTCTRCGKETRRSYDQNEIGRDE